MLNMQTHSHPELARLVRAAVALAAMAAPLLLGVVERALALL